MKQLVTIFCILLFTFQSEAQTKQAPEVPSPIIFIYDASGSMWGQMQGKTKMEIASTVLSNSINDFAENQKIGLVAYGHRKKGDCRDVETLLPISNTSKSEVALAVKNIKPLGMTPLAYSAEMVMEQLRKSKEKATIVLITDGIESCDGNICDVVKAAKKEGIDFKLHIVGFGLKAGETKQLECAAKAGDGNYYDAADASGLSEAMTEVASETVDKPKGNHGVYATMNGKAIDALVTAYKAGTKNKAGGTRTYRDTSFVYLPQETYDLEIRPLENSRVEPIILKGIKTSNDNKTYSIISFDGGKFAVTSTNNGEGWDSTVKILDADGKTVGGGRTYGRTKEFELNAGTYSVVLQAIKLNGIHTKAKVENQVVTAGQTTAVDYNFESGTLEVVPMGGGKNIDATVNVIEVNSRTSVGGGRSYDRGVKMNINPGTYEIKVRALKKTGFSGDKSATVTVKKGEAIKQTFNY
ncbi:vWA domain-containing protein [Aequorivita flava]|uniref:VWA domain-containing protein n=1 Tax=Aequorivita flava TaxID=3114371 RepID=A0AB35YWT8_9FLAO